MFDVLSKLMDESGITAYKLSKDTGISQSVISSWKNKLSIPRKSSIKKIADYFGVSVEYLLGECQEPEKKDKLDSVDEIELTQEEIDFIKNYYRPSSQEERDAFRILLQKGKQLP